MAEKKMMINVTHTEESRVAIVADGVLETFEIETFDYKAQKGNIYKAKVESIHQGLQAAFVDIGAARSGFLPLDELNFKVHPARGGGHGRIEHHLSRGQELLVQVVRDAYGTKPPTLSTYFSLPGRYMVLTPFSDSAGVSRKLDDAQRDKLRKTLEGLPLPEGFGMIVRTAGATATKTELLRDLKYLLRLWETIDEAARTVRAPKLIYKERSLVIRAIRDLYTPDIEEITVDDPDTQREIVEFFELVLPNKKTSVKLYQGDRPIFNKFNLEEQIENIFRRRVPLPSGGAIIFDTTEALTAVDVNSGKMKSEGHIEDTALKANLEAAQEICRQLRLRDMGGLVVIDFIDMRSSKNIRAVEKVMKDGLKKDKARYDVTRISSLGLFELSRERLNPEKSSLRYTDCVHCDGTGSVKTIEAAAVQAIRRLQTRIVRGDLSNVEVELPPDVAEYLQNAKRAELAGLEERYRTHILVKSDPEMIRDECEVRTVAREESLEAKPVVAAPKHTEILADIDEATEEEAIAEAAAAAATAVAGGEAEEGGDESTDEGGKKRRRRRRGGRKHRRKREGLGATNGNGGAPADAGGASAAQNAGDADDEDEDDGFDQSSAGDDAHGEESTVTETPAGSAGGGLAAGAEGERGDGASRRRRRRRRRRRGGGGGGDASGSDNGNGADTTVEHAREPETVGVLSAIPPPAPPAARVAQPLSAHVPLPRPAAGPDAPRMAWWKRLVAPTAEKDVGADAE